MQRNGVVVVGSHVQGLFMNVSRFPGPDETVLGWNFKEALDGGKGSHQAIACGRPRITHSFCGARRPRSTRRNWCFVDDGGRGRSYLSGSLQTNSNRLRFRHDQSSRHPRITTAMGANAEFSHEDIDRAESVFAQAKLALMTLEIPLSSALYAARLAKKHGAYTILTPGPAEPVAPDGFAGIDLLIPNENEASTLLGVPAKGHDPAWLAEQLQKHFGLKQIVITLGGNGVYIADGDKRQTLPAFKVSVVETPGAGDCFTAGLAFGLYHDASLVDAASFGCLTAARSVSIPGSIPGFGTLKGGC